MAHSTLRIGDEQKMKETTRLTEIAWVRDASRGKLLKNLEFNATHLKPSEAYLAFMTYKVSQSSRKACEVLSSMLRKEF